MNRVLTSTARSSIRSISSASSFGTKSLAGRFNRPAISNKLITSNPSIPKRSCSVTPSEIEGKVPSWREIIVTPLSDRRRNRGWIGISIFAVALFEIPKLFIHKFPQYDEPIWMAETATTDDEKRKWLTFLTLWTTFGMAFGGSEFRAHSRQVQHLIYLLDHPDPVLQAQAIGIVSGLVEDRSGVEALFHRLPLEQLVRHCLEEPAMGRLLETLNLIERVAFAEELLPEIAAIPGLYELIEMSLSSPTPTVENMGPEQEMEVTYHRNIKQKATHLVAMMSRSKDRSVVSQVAALVPYMYEVEREGVDRHSVMFARESISNAVRFAPNDTLYQRFVHERLNLVSPDVETLNQILDYHREDPVATYIPEALAGAMFFGALWGSLRWSAFLKDYTLFRKRNLGVQLPTARILRYRAPITAIGAAITWSQMRFDTSLAELTERYLPYAQARAVSVANLLFGTVIFWATLGIAPYTIIPSFLYPLLWFGIHSDNPSADYKWEEFNHRSTLQKIIFPNRPLSQVVPKDQCAEQDRHFRPKFLSGYVPPVDPMNPSGSQPSGYGSPSQGQASGSPSDPKSQSGSSRK
eukprot:TRINITY_DN11078_c0_g1_i1.p1 TRINITY_DN11078_c0_g1~~TRINITY_DN11078_c0_g1_i1.p1  ORF type:complete len:580 (+),score=108.61 TRINITY_DN11078_c0_g1_i1:191-1930(+)